VNDVAAFVVGITAARAGDCKRGVAANVAARCAADGDRRVAIVDADPASRDVGDRLGAVVAARIAWPPLHVTPMAGGPVPPDIAARVAAAQVSEVSRDHDLVVVDLPLGAGAPGPSLDAGLAGLLDRLVIMTSVTPESLTATARYTRLVAEAHRRGHIRDTLELVVTLALDAPAAPHELVQATNEVGLPVLGAVPQYWGRTPPNLGFGPTLGFAPLDAALRRLGQAPVAGCSHAATSNGHSCSAAHPAVSSVK
jgi:MinD-like ATPase involved in chromosome partitioning or flagellar assembly